MNRIDRLFGMLTLLQSKKFVTAEKIAEQFGISVRTVYRDVKALCSQGIPVSFEQHKGYFIVQGYFLPPVAFSTEEANALLLMETMVAGFADRSISRHYSNALSKIKSVLRNGEKEKLERLNGQIRFQLPDCFRKDFEYLSSLQNAITSQSMVELEYRSKSGDTSRRTVEPIGLVHYAFSWHLIAWCHLRGEYRDFKVGNLLKLCVTGAPFEKPDHMALNDYMKLLPVAY